MVADIILHDDSIEFVGPIQRLDHLGTSTMSVDAIAAVEIGTQKLTTRDLRVQGTVHGAIEVTDPESGTTDHATLEKDELMIVGGGDTVRYTPHGIIYYGEAGQWDRVKLSHIPGSEATGPGLSVSDDFTDGAPSVTLRAGTATEQEGTRGVVNPITKQQMFIPTEYVHLEPPAIEVEVPERIRGFRHDQLAMIGLGTTPSEETYVLDLVKEVIHLRNVVDELQTKVAELESHH